MSISDKLTQLNTIKTNIKAAIIAKGGTATDDMTTYATSISNIPTGSSYTGDETWGTVVTYTITPTLTNCTAGASNPSTIEQGSTATLTFTATSGYTLPSSVTVTGATGTWTQATGTLVLSNPTGAITFTITALVQLDAPVITASGTTITLAEVTNATSYEVYADGTSIGEYVNGYTLSVTTDIPSDLIPDPYSDPPSRYEYTNACFKIGSAPSSNTDYDYYAYVSGTTTSLKDKNDTTITEPLTLSNTTKIYIWDCGDGGVGGAIYQLNGTLYTGQISYSNPTEVTLTQNSTLVLGAYYD